MKNLFSRTSATARKRANSESPSSATAAPQQQQNLQQHQQPPVVPLLALNNTNNVVPPIDVSSTNGAPLTKKGSLLQNAFNNLITVLSPRKQGAQAQLQQQPQRGPSSSTSTQTAQPLSPDSQGASSPSAATPHKRKRKKEITFEDIQPYFHLPIKEAAEKLGVSLTQLKRICREQEIPRWPHRKLQSLQNKIDDLIGMLEKTDEVTRLRIENKIEAHKQEKEYIIRFPKSIGKITKEGKRNSIGKSSKRWSGTLENVFENNSTNNKRWSMGSNDEDTAGSSENMDSEDDSSCSIPSPSNSNRGSHNFDDTASDLLRQKLKRISVEGLTSMTGDGSMDQLEEMYLQQQLQNLQNQQHDTFNSQQNLINNISDNHMSTMQRRHLSMSPYLMKQLELRQHGVAPNLNQNAATSNNIFQQGFQTNQSNMNQFGMPSMGTINPVNPMNTMSTMNAMNASLMGASAQPSATLVHQIRPNSVSLQHTTIPLSPQNNSMSISPPPTTNATTNTMPFLSNNTNAFFTSAQPGARPQSMQMNGMQIPPFNSNAGNLSAFGLQQAQQQQFHQIPSIDTLLQQSQYNANNNALQQFNNSMSQTQAWGAQNTNQQQQQQAWGQVQAAPQPILPPLYSNNGVNASAVPSHANFLDSLVNSNSTQGRVLPEAPLLPPVNFHNDDLSNPNGMQRMNSAYSATGMNGGMDPNARVNPVVNSIRNAIAKDNSALLSNRQQQENVESFYPKPKPTYSRHSIAALPQFADLQRQIQESDRLQQQQREFDFSQQFQGTNTSLPPQSWNAAVLAQQQNGGVNSIRTQQNSNPNSTSPTDKMSLVEALFLKKLPFLKKGKSSKK